MKQNLADQIGMRFDEVTDLFGEETLESMSMALISGGAGDGTNKEEDTYENCGKGVNCTCKNTNCGAGTVCKTSSGTSQGTPS